MKKITWHIPTIILLLIIVVAIELKKPEPNVILVFLVGVVLAVLALKLLETKRRRS